MGLLLGLLSLVLLHAHALAQTPSASAPGGAPAPAPLMLSAQTPVVSLDGHARLWIEPGTQKSIDDIQAAEGTLPWVPRARNEQHNIDGKALWLQFDAAVTDGGRWYLELASSGLDRSQLFYRDAAGRWVEQEAGDTRPVSKWPLPGRVPTFELAGQDGKPVRYWVRIEHARSNFAAPVSLYSQGALLASREREQFLLGAYFGLAALIAFVSIANAAVHRDRNFAAYAVYVVTLTLGQVAYLGVGAQHIWDNWLRWNEVATFVLPGVSSAAAIWFVKVVTEPARFSRALDLAVWSLIAALLSAVALDTFLTSRASFALVMALTVIALAVVVALVALVWVHGDDPHIRLIALGFLPVVLMAMFPVARGLNLIPASAWTRYGLSIGAALEMPILFYALSLRGSRRREAQLRASALSHTDALTGLAHSRSFLSRLEGALARSRSQKHACALLALELSNHEPIVQEFGPEVGERALVVAASHLRHVISDIDLAARVGTRHFAILLEGPTTTTNAQVCAQHLVARGLGGSPALPPTVTLKFHVAMALLPDKHDAAGSLAWLLEAVRGIKPDARKPIQSINF